MSDEAALVVVAVLERAGVPYMVVGSLSSNYYGVPRSTKDVDIVIQFDLESLRALVAELGPNFHLDPQLSVEMVTGMTKNIIELTDTAFKIELFHLSDDAHDQERFRRRQRVKLLGQETFLPTAEDVIVTKLRWCLQTSRSKDREDIGAVIALQGERLDWDYIQRWCDVHGTREVLEEIRRSLPPA